MFEDYLVMCDLVLVIIIIHNQVIRIKKFCDIVNNKVN